MTITTSTDRPTLSSPASRVTAAAEIAACCRATGRLYREQTIWLMRQSGRDELIHYAGAAHRDRVAWHVTLAWLEQINRTESECKSLALAAAGWGNLTPEQIRAANPGMR